MIPPSLSVPPPRRKPQKRQNGDSPHFLSLSPKNAQTVIPFKPQKSQNGEAPHFLSTPPHGGEALSWRFQTPIAKTVIPPHFLCAPASPPAPSPPAGVAFSSPTTVIPPHFLSPRPAMWAFSVSVGGNHRFGVFKPKHAKTVIRPHFLCAPASPPSPPGVAFSSPTAVIIFCPPAPQCAGITVLAFSSPKKRFPRIFCVPQPPPPASSLQPVLMRRNHRFGVFKPKNAKTVIPRIFCVPQPPPHPRSIQLKFTSPREHTGRVDPKPLSV